MFLCTYINTSHYPRAREPQANDVDDEVDDDDGGGYQTNNTAVIEQHGIPSSVLYGIMARAAKCAVFAHTSERTPRQCF